ncbi:hypothetical protein ACFL2Q_03030, partial [Thermodesulfobacteriota bacterium]
PAEFKISLSEHDAVSMGLGKPVRCYLQVFYQVQGAESVRELKELPLTLAFSLPGAPKATDFFVSTPTGEQENTLSFSEEGGSLYLRGHKVGFKTKGLLDYYQIQKVKLDAGPAMLWETGPLKAADLPVDMSVSLDKEQSAQLWVNTPDSARLLITYSQRGSDEKKTLNLPLTLTVPGKPEEIPPRPRFVLVADPNSTDPIEKVPAKWVDGKVQIGGIYLKTRDAIPEKLLRHVREVQLIVNDREVGDPIPISKLPLPISFTADEEWSEDVTPGPLRAEAKIYYRWPGENKELTEFRGFTLLVPPPPTPFKLVNEDGEPLSELSFRSTGRSWVLDNAFLAVDDKGLLKRDPHISNISLAVGSAQPKSMQPPRRTTAEPIPLSFRFERGELQGLNPGKDGLGHTDCHLTVLYTYSGRMTPVERSFDLEASFPALGGGNGVPYWAKKLLFALVGLTLLAVICFVLYKAFKPRPKTVHFKINIKGEHLQQDTECGPYELKPEEKLGLSRKSEFVKYCDDLDSPDCHITSRNRKLWLVTPSAPRGVEMLPNAEYRVTSEAKGDSTISMIPVRPTELKTKKKGRAEKPKPEEATEESGPAQGPWDDL